jgi:hypothetical protein
MKKMIISILLTVYIFNISTIGYSANQNEKIALKSNLEHIKIVEALMNTSIKNVQLLRKTAPLEYEKFISEYYTNKYQPIFNKSWDKLTSNEKEFFLYIGVNTNLSNKIKSLSFSTIDYLAEFISNYGDQEIIQNNFELILSLIPKDTNFFGSLIGDDDSLLYVKILEKFLVNFGIIKSKKPKITSRLYQGSLPAVKEAVDKFFGLLLKNRLKIKDEETAKKIVTNFSQKNIFFLRNQLFLNENMWDTTTVKFLLTNYPDMIMEDNLFAVYEQENTLSELAIAKNDTSITEKILQAENALLNRIKTADKIGTYSTQEQYISFEFRTRFGFIIGSYGDLFFSLLKKFTQQRHLAFKNALSNKNIKMIKLILQYQALMSADVNSFHTQYIQSTQYKQWLSMSPSTLERQKDNELNYLKSSNNKPLFYHELEKYIRGRLQIPFPSMTIGKPMYPYFEEEIKLLQEPENKKICLEVLKTADWINLEHANGQTIAYWLMEIAINTNNTDLASAILDNPEIDITSNNEQLLQLIQNKEMFEKNTNLKTKVRLAIFRSEKIKKSIDQKIRNLDDKEKNTIIKILEFFIKLQIISINTIQNTNLVPTLSAFIFNFSDQILIDNINPQKLHKIRTMGV